MRKLPTYSQVAAVLRTEAGVLYWIAHSGSGAAGKVAGHLKRNGYLNVGIFGLVLPAHRVVWLLTHGRWPGPILDHINGIKLDNRPENLREVTDQMNCANRAAIGAVKFKGVVLHKQTGRFQATCAKKYLGLFDTPEAAGLAYDAAAKATYGEYARLNFRSAT